MCASAVAESRASISFDPHAKDFSANEIERIYDREYVLQFGRRSPRKDTPKNAQTFTRLVYLFASEGIDPATYIAANMRAMRPFLERSSFGFQPNMLSGERARGRYNAFLRHANRRYKRGLADVAQVDTDVASLRRALVDGETDVGDLFVRARWSGTPLTWEEAVQDAEPNDDWLALYAEAGTTFRRWSAMLGAKGLARERRLAQLQAAVAVADSFESEFSTRVGVTEFSWEALADLIARTFEWTPRPTYDLAGIPGGLWR